MGGRDGGGGVRDGWEGWGRGRESKGTPPSFFLRLTLV